MLVVSSTKKFKQGYKGAGKRGKDLTKLEDIINLLAHEQPLPAKNMNHKLTGNYDGCWECHIEPDWLLIYDKTEKEIILLKTGTHSDLFE